MTDANDLYYMRARFYSPDLRRFINQDILLGGIENGQSLNRYAYVMGDPIKYNDPFGLTRYCGKCASTDCLLYGGNICPSNTIIEQFANGFASYFRAYLRGFIQTLRENGLMGECEQNFTELEEKLLSKFMDEFTYLYQNDEKFRKKVDEEAEKASNNFSVATFAGRAFANSLTTILILRGSGGTPASLALGINLTVVVGYNDLRYYVQVAAKSGKELSLETMISIFLAGEASDFVKYYDTSCACRGKD